MSQVQTRQNIDELEAVPFRAASTTFSAASVLFDSLSSMSAAAMKDFITGSVDLKPSSFNAYATQTDLKSPNAMRFAFSEMYTNNLNTFSTQNIDVLVKQKLAVTKTISELSYRVVNKTAVEEKIIQLMNADKKMFKKSVEATMNEIQAQHSQVFINELTQIVSKASVEAGFKTVNVIIKNSVPVITSVNELGQGIISEVRTDNKTKVLDLVSETIGMADGSCNDAMQKFGDALNKYGVKFSNLNRKWTGGNCWLPNAKDAEKSISEAKGKKQLDRARKLNTNSKIKN